MNSKAAMENYNYYNDSRVRGEYSTSGLYDFDERKMIAFIELYEWDEHLQVNVRFEVCPTCHGHAKHVNPSIDAGGLTDEDFDRDPDFYEQYMSGLYDVNCYECKGRAVVPALDKDNNPPDIVEAYEKQRKELAADAAYSAWERSMGA